MDVEVTGAKEAAAALERFARDAAAVDLSDVGDLGVEELARTSPRDTGRLAGSWEVVADPGVVHITTGLVYGSVQNYGWPGHNIEPLRFVERTAEILLDRAGEIMTPELDELIARL